MTGWIGEFEIDPDTQDQIATLLPAAFDEVFSGGHYFLHPHHLRLLERDDAGQVIGHLAVQLRSVRIGSEVWPFAGVADVAVAPAAQGQGVGQRLIEEAVGEMRRRDVPLMLLFGVSGIYRRAGFVDARNMLSYANVDQAGSHGIIRAAAHDLMAQWLDGRGWDHRPAVDLLGPKF